ncbi:DUF6542 domain-containing protein [Streptomyces sp. NPDC005925]|uniref:DUF6542 domain-containing protein n=1 Tax=Streptomyces sp. NPDC005925 TaxID=3157172 RepID=UPI00340A93D6
MEQPRTRPAQYGPQGGRPPLPPLPPQTDRAAGGPPRPAPGTPGPAAPRETGGSGGGIRSRNAGGPGPRLAALLDRLPAVPPGLARHLRRLRHRFPDPRLTGLGSGLFCVAVMLLLGLLDQLLFGSLTVYGVLFVPVCALTSVWVRPSDLPTAPVAVPIAFALGLLPVAPRGDGAGDRLMGIVTALATEAGWLYGGTLVAGVIVIARRIRLVRRRTAARNRATASPP